MNKKIVFFQNGPGLGPITYNNFRLSSILVNRGFFVELLGTSVKTEVYAHAPLDVCVSSLNADNSVKVFVRLVKYLSVNKPDILLVSGPALHAIAGLSKALTGYPKVLVTRIHAHTSSLFEDRSWVNKSLLVILMRLANKWTSFRLATSRGAADDWADILNLDKNAIDVMFNPVLGPNFNERLSESIEHPWFADAGISVILSVARLAPEKSLHVLLQAFAELSYARKGIRLMVIGEGPLKADLQKEVSRLNIDNLVEFVGKVDNPFPYMKRSELFVLTSRYEGFANVIAEALACGCRVVSTDAPSGPSEILCEGKFGRLVPVGDVKELTMAMAEALDCQQDKEQLRERGKRFHVERILDDIDYIFEN